MMELFGVFDAAAERYLEPFPAPTVDFAIRGFKEACMKQDHQFAKFPEDYVLYHLGSFDPENGQIKEVQPHKVAMATSFTGGSE